MKRFVVSVLALCFVLSLASCAKTAEPAEVPADFRFSLEWGVNGESAYDSETGKLVKQKIASRPEDYTTTLWLSDGQKAEIFCLIRDMDPDKYPDEYKPLKGRSSPSSDIVLTVSYDGKTKTITCADVPSGNAPDGIKGKKFMAVHDRIVGIIKSSAEWQALPDYEFFYD